MCAATFLINAFGGRAIDAAAATFTGSSSFIACRDLVARISWAEVSGRVA
jgi:hypothetical protein